MAFESTNHAHATFSVGIGRSHSTCRVASHHDSIFHRTFADPTNAMAMFMAVLPPELVKAID